MYDQLLKMENKLFVDNLITGIHITYMFKLSLSRCPAQERLC